MNAALRAARVLALAGVIAAALSLAILRIYSEPIFGPSDENDHFDYALSIARAGHLLSAHNALGFPTADLESAFLETYTDFPRVYLNPGEREPSGPPAYGSHQYFARIDYRSHAELPDPHEYLNAPDHPNPVLVSMYPFAYYAADAIVMDGVASVTHSLVDVFYSARWFSTGLLALTLVYTFALLRRLRFSQTFALAFTAIVGCFGLSTFVAAYVQPDNLAWLATTATLYHAVRYARRPERTQAIALALWLGVLAVTKYQVALCVAAAVVPAAAYSLYLTSRSWKRVLGTIVAGAVPALVLLLIQTVGVGKNESFQQSLATHFVPVTALPGLVAQAIWYYFIGNVSPPLTHDYRYASALSYWNYFGNLDTDVILVNPAINAVVRFGIAALTGTVAILAVVRSIRVGRRLYALAASGRRRMSVRLALANIPLNAYACFIAFMIAIYALTNNNWRQSGRNWIAFIVPALLLGVAYAPRALPSVRLRRAFGGGILALLAAYSTVGTYYAAAAVQARYYGRDGLPPLSALARSRTTDILIAHVNGVSVDTHPEPVEPIVRGQNIEIEGLATDMDAHDAAGGVIAIVDGRDSYAASYQYSHQDFSELLHEPKLFWAGFQVSIPATDIGLGLHRITFAVVSKDRKRYSPTPRVVTVEVVDPGPVRPLVMGASGGLTGSLDKVVDLESATIDGTEMKAVALGLDRSLYVRGWLVDLALRRAVRSLTMVIDAKRRVAIHMGELRPELQETFPSVEPMAAAYAGFSAVVPLRPLGIGQHRFSLEAVGADGRSHEVVANFPIAVLPSRLGNVLTPEPVAMPHLFSVRGDYRGSLDAVAPLRDETYWNPELVPTWIPRGEPIVVRGWAVDLAHERNLRSIVARIDGGPPHAVRLGDIRPDVVVGLAKVRQSATAPSGFDLAIASDSLSLGVHEISVTSIDPKTGRPFTILRRFPFTVY